MKFLRRKEVRTCLSMLLIVTCLLASFFIGDLHADAKTIIRTGTVINTTWLNMRKGPGTEYDSIGSLQEGTSGTILDQKAATTGKIWYQMKVGGQTGWVSSSYIKVTETVVEDDKDFDAYLTAQGFPESYKAQLQALHAKYPNWVFQAQHTNLTWDEVIKAESSLAKNLVHAGAPTSWKSMQNGAYNWETGEWVVFDSGGWVAASTEVIQHFMDPRNFLDETTIFQFLRQSYNASEYNETQLAEIKAGLTKMVSNTFLKGMCDDRPYIDVIMEVAANKGVSPYVLASMMIQEMGVNGDSNSMSGTLPGYEGYYNYFNVAAYKTETLTAIQKGLTYAMGSGSYGRPWNTRYKSIAGGAEYYAEGYVKKGQDTMYLKKFNVQGSNLYGHQYMTNVQGASSEGKHMAKAYDENARQGSLVFKIPVYKNMPETACARPTDNRNPNYMLKSLGVSGYSLTPTFSMHETSYSLIVPNSASTVTINAQAIAGTTTITGAGSKNLNVGSNTFNITSTAENGTKKVYTVTIVRQEGVAPEPPQEPSDPSTTPSISSQSYKVNSDNTITGITSTITAGDFKTKFAITNGEVKITTTNGTVKSSTANVGTGDQVRVYDSAGVCKLTYTVVVYGDADGDGKTGTTDYVQIRKQILGTYSMGTYNKKAADTNRNGKVDTADYVQVRKHILGDYKIQQ